MKFLLILDKRVPSISYSFVSLINLSDFNLSSSSGIYFVFASSELLLIEEIKYIHLILIGIFGVVGQIGLTLAYQLDKASYIAPYSYFYIIFSGFIGYYIWNEIPDMLSIIGYLFIIISYYFLIRLQNK